MKKILFAVVLLGCQKTNPYFCPDDPNNLCVGDGGNGSGSGSGSNTKCDSNSDCSGMLSVCELSSGTCVECLVDSSCSGKTPACDTASHSCEACITPDDCGGADGTCMADGSCAAKSDVAWVTAGGDDVAGVCTHDQPCSTIAKAQSMSKPIIHVVGTVTGNVGTVGDQIIVGERDANGKLTSILKASTGVVVTNATMSNKLTLQNLEIQASSANSDAINMFSNGTAEVDVLRCTLDGDPNNDAMGRGTGYGINATAQAGAKVVVDRTDIKGFKLAGVYVNNAGSSLTMTNSFITNNGTGIGNGGIYLTGGAAATIDFSTIAVNAGGTAGGINLSGSSCAVTNSVIANNSAPQVTNLGLTLAYSNLSPNDTSFVLDATSMSVDPSFVDKANGNFHLAATSMLIDKANSSSIKVDWDGDQRPMGAARDIGADEAK